MERMGTILSTGQFGRLKRTVRWILCEYLAVFPMCVILMYYIYRATLVCVIHFILNWIPTVISQTENRLYLSVNPFHILSKLINTIGSVVLRQLLQS